MQPSYETTRGAEVVGDAVKQLLDSGISPADAGAMLLYASTDVVRMEEPIEVVHAHACHLERHAKTLMRYVERIDPKVLKQFD